ncbi:P-loop containing nucleoside triphosphate hydrolase protein [Coniochaeta ligniaria NRRL 30616]|uniref:p-loop containing nucleoside triphosphate hydrolase protein n=1 Tax=Coniochaeta ligniaria NRRL 30616 TaxID=1408157 RepID=A0A1J7JRN1_9PEZI|nr:P-loop containing nucleoside triphosphate hydrolase protein [Coniochaeta ligniaria NRRL 30616]
MLPDNSSTIACQNDGAVLGPTVIGCRDDFDFTVAFEESFFAIAPSACFIVLALARIWHLRRKPGVVNAPRFQILKLAAIALYTGLELSLFVLTCKDVNASGARGVASAALYLLDAVLFLALSVLEHSRSPRSSILLNGYLLLSLLLDATRTRTLWLSRPHSAITALFTAAVSSKISVLLLEAQGKTRWTSAKDYSPESLSGLFALGSFTWLNRLIATGYKKVMAPQHLFPLDSKLSAEHHSEKFHRSWVAAGNKAGHRRLLWVLASTLSWRILLPVLPRIILGAFAFSQPFLINSLLGYLESAPTRSRNEGYGFIGAAGIIYAGIAVSTGFYRYFHQRLLTSLRACLTGAIYKATTELGISAKDASSVLTLMDSDVSMIQNGFDELHECWVNPIEVGIASWLLQRQLGAAFAAPLVVVLLCAVSSFAIGNFAGARRNEWMTTIQKRVGVTSDVVSAMVPIKLSGLVPRATAAIRRRREEELNGAKRFRLLVTYATIAGYAPLLISPAATFAVTGRALTVQNVFTSLAYIQLLCNPLTHLFQVIPQLMAALTCLERIERFLVFGTTDDSEAATLAREGRTEYTANEDKQAVGLARSPPDAAAVLVEDGEFGWDQTNPVLHGVNVKIPAAKLTIVVGPVASGKSTLLKGLLKELPLTRGQVSMASNRVAYCDQEPFLSHGSIRDNIVGCGNFDVSWYEEVLEVTALKQDIASFPAGDKTDVGTNGVSLSGGQRQRLALARAVYSRPTIALLDDVLSGLDGRTEEHVFRRVIGPGGVLSKIGATVILCTQAIHYLPAADHVVVLGDQTVLEQGSFSDLESSIGLIHQVARNEGAESTGTVSQADPSSNTLPTIPKASVEALEDKARQQGDISVYKTYFSRFGTSSIVAFFASGLIFAFLYNFGTVWLELWSASIQRGENRRLFFLGIYIMIQVLCLLLMGAYVSFFSMYMAVRASFKIHDELLCTVMAAPLSFLTSVDAGVITNYFSQDISTVDNTLSGALSNTVLTGLTALGQASVIATASPYVLIGYPALIGVLFVVSKVYLRTSRQLRFLEAEAKAPLYTHFMETLRGRLTLRAFGWVAPYIRRQSQLLNDSQRPLYLLAMLQQWLTFVLNMTIAGLAVVIITIATQLHTGAGFTGVGLVSLMSFGEMMANVVRLYTMLEISTGSLSRLKRLGEKVPAENVADETNEPGADWPASGEVHLDDVSASYETFNATSLGVLSDTGEKPANVALRNITLSFRGGEKVAVCGRTGSGKSSIILLLNRLLETTSGSITIDNIPLTSIPREIIRDRIITLPQTPFFFPTGTTVRANIEHLPNSRDPVPTPSAPESCQAALEAVGLWATISSRGGLDADFTASALSQGQKQLFSLARAVYRARTRLNHDDAGGGVLLLDEFNSTVDADTDRLMQGIIRRKFERYTVICVAHRLESVMEYDRVVVMDGGRVVENGAPRELVRRGGRFRELWDAKARSSQAGRE